MSTDGGAKVFRTDMRPLMRICVTLAAWSTPALMIAAVLGQLRADRFPSYFDILGAGLIGLGLAAALAIFLALCVRFFTVTVYPDGLRGYNVVGFYRTVRWTDIEKTGFVVLSGIPYLQVFSTGRDDPLVVPLWLSDMPGFVRAVSAYGGRSHAIVQALNDAA